jgi:hypothetical protein
MVAYYACKLANQNIDIIMKKIIIPTIVVGFVAVSMLTLAGCDTDKGTHSSTTTTQQTTVPAPITTTTTDTQTK